MRWCGDVKVSSYICVGFVSCSGCRSLCNEPDHIRGKHVCATPVMIAATIICSLFIINISSRRRRKSMVCTRQSVENKHLSCCMFFLYIDIVIIQAQAHIITSQCTVVRIRVFYYFMQSSTVVAVAHRTWVALAVACTAGLTRLSEWLIQKQQYHQFRGWYIH